MEHDWETTYTRLVQLFDETPGAELEQRVKDHFEDNPVRVIAQGEDLGKKIKHGADVRSGWAVLSKMLDTVQRNVANVYVSDTAARERAILAARRWLHNAGLYFQQESQVLDELFEGLLRAYDSEQLRSEMLEAWKQERERLDPAELELAGSAEPQELPDWVRRWKLARKKGDQRLFPEQADGLRELHEAQLAESTMVPTKRQLEQHPDLYRPGVKVSGYELELALLERPRDDRGAWVQPDEYLDVADPEPW